MIIPQEPVLFTGDVRKNLDPFNQHSDTELWQALERSNLKQFVAAMPLKLAGPVTKDGENFSVGQRQLFSLARALLRRARILVLDEATASMDVETDALLQKTLRTEFDKTTMMIIAHRMNTIIDCDKIIVLDKGSLKEHGTPSELLQNPVGDFYALVHNTGPAEEERLHRIANGNRTEEVSHFSEVEKHLHQLEQQKIILSAQMQHVNEELKLCRQSLYANQKPLLEQKLDPEQFPGVLRLQDAVNTVRTALSTPAAGLTTEIQALELSEACVTHEMQRLVASMYAQMPMEVQAQNNQSFAAAYKQEVSEMVTSLYNLVSAGRRDVDMSNYDPHRHGDLELDGRHVTNLANALGH